MARRTDGEHIAVIGQVGIAGPVALATARLHALKGDVTTAHEHLRRARVIAERTGGLPSLVRIDLAECELTADAHRAARVGADADRLDMAGVAKKARELA